VLIGCDPSRLGSRPRKIRVRLRSSSRGAPGARSAAPVGRSGISRRGNLRSGRREDSPSPPRPMGTFSATPPRPGGVTTSGSRSITRRPAVSSTPRPRRSGFPKSLRGIRVTPRHGPSSRRSRRPPGPPYPGRSWRSLRALRLSRLSRPSRRS